MIPDFEQNHFLAAHPRSSYMRFGRIIRKQEGAKLNKQDVVVDGCIVGYVELVRPGDLWKAVVYGSLPYPPPMFGSKSKGIQYVIANGKKNNAGR